MTSDYLTRLLVNNPHIITHLPLWEVVAVEVHVFATDGHPMPQHHNLWFALTNYLGHTGLPECTKYVRSQNNRPNAVKLIRLDGKLMAAIMKHIAATMYSIP